MCEGKNLSCWKDDQQDVQVFQPTKAVKKKNQNEKWNEQQNKNKIAVKLIY